MPCESECERDITLKNSYVTYCSEHAAAYFDLCRVKG